MGKVRQNCPKAVVLASLFKDYCYEFYLELLVSGLVNYQCGN